MADRICWNPQCRKKGSAEAVVFESRLCYDCYDRAGLGALSILHLTNTVDALTLTNDQGQTIATFPGEDEDAVARAMIEWAKPYGDSLAIVGFPVREIAFMLDAEEGLRKARDSVRRLESIHEQTLDRLAAALAVEAGLVIGDRISVQTSPPWRNKPPKVGQIVKFHANATFRPWKPDLEMVLSWIKKDGTLSQRSGIAYGDKWEKIESEVADV